MKSPLGDKIYARRVARGLTIAEAAERAGLAFSAWASAESGSFSPETLERIASVPLPAKVR